MRVLLKRIALSFASKGITPACAGTTAYSWPLKVTLWDHPRVCGYYLSPQKSPSMPLGSPPRVRVLLTSQYLYRLATRITPACAGTTVPCQAIAPQREDHPRVCGYYLLPYFSDLGPQGSPPRVRVLLYRIIDTDLSERITPACAGTTKKVLGVQEVARDHPRVCGYYVRTSWLSTSDGGSPPRVRVLRAKTMYRYQHPGITPACAGTTVSYA